MKRNILYLITTFLFFITSCQKEKFENEGVYSGEFISFVEYEGDEYKVVTNVFIELRNETKNSIELNGVLLTKNGRKLNGIIPEEKILWYTREVEIELKRDAFSTDINGTYTTETLYMSDWRSTRGTVYIKHL